MEEAEKTCKQKNEIEGEKKDQGIENAQEMRERALETFAETKKRNKDLEDSQEKKKRRKRPDHLGRKLYVI